MAENTSTSDAWKALLAIQDPPADSVNPLGTRRLLGDLRAPLEFVLSTDDFTVEQRRTWVEYLIQTETDLDPQDCYPAAVAAGGRAQKKLLELLAGAGVDMRRATKMKCTALHAAASCARPSVVQFLVDQGIEVNARDDAGRTALHWAIRGENKPAYRVLYAAGADWKLADVKGETPLSELRTRHPQQANWWMFRPTRDALVQGLASVQPSTVKPPRSRL